MNSCFGFRFSYLPVGVLFMIASHVVEVHDWESTVKLGMFSAVVVLGYVGIYYFSTVAKMTLLVLL